MTKTSLQRLIIVLLSMHFTLYIAAQTITVIDAEGTAKQINASEVGTMTYSQTDGTLTIAGQAYKVASPWMKRTTTYPSSLWQALQTLLSGCIATSATTTANASSRA